MPNSNKHILRRIADEIVNGRNLAAADTLIARDYVFHGPGGLELRGPDGFTQMIGMYQTAFPDFNIVIEDMVEDGDRIAFRLTARGTHRGSLGPIAPTGTTVITNAIIINRFADGKCVEEWQSVDEVSLLRQLGVTTLPAAAHT